MLPDVDVRTVESKATWTINELPLVKVENGATVVIQGVASIFGTTILGKTELFLIDSATGLGVFCSFVFGEPKIPFTAGNTIAVKGVWQNINPNTLGRDGPIIGSLNDCIVPE